MLHAFLAAHRDEILADSFAKIAAKNGTGRSAAEIQNNLPVFYDALIEALRKDGGEAPTAQVSKVHGEQRQRTGFAMVDVVHDYGSLCHSIMDAAQRAHQEITVREYQILNAVLDEGIAEGIQQFDQDRKARLDLGAAERLGVLAHELRNALHGAALAFQAVRTGRVPVQGRTGDLIERSHHRLRELIALLTTQARLGAGQRLHREQIPLRVILDEVVALAMGDAAHRQIALSVALDDEVVVNGDRVLLNSVLTNLLQNGIKYSRVGGGVQVRARQAPDLSVVIEVEDECGGLEPGVVGTLFKPFVQASGDRTGLGLGLSIARESVEAHGGTISVRDLPGKGCVFELVLPPG